MAVPRLLVTRSDEAMSDAVVFTGTRVPVQTLLDYLEEGDTRSFFGDFPTLSREMPRAQGVAIPIPNDFA